MKYYKVIIDNEFIGVGTTYDLRKFQLKHNILLVADDNTAQYIQIDNKLYRDNWFKSLITDALQYKMSTISIIDENEYQQLSETINKNEEIIIETEESGILSLNNNVIDKEEKITIEYLKSKKIKEMSYMCNQTIINGFDVALSDNKQYHFSLTIQDQLNLITLSAMISNGETAIPYHADGQLCKIFSAEDMDNIIQTATMFKTYHTTYYNSLKSYIQSLDTREEIGKVSYGMNIPDEYQSEVLKDLIKKMSMV